MNNFLASYNNKWIPSRDPERYMARGRVINDIDKFVKKIDRSVRNEEFGQMIIAIKFPAWYILTNYCSSSFSETVNELFL